MKEILDLVSAKENLREAQDKFVKKLNADFPCIEKSDTTHLLDEVSSEFELLLSSTVKSKSGRIIIPAKTGWKDGVVLTRNPGLKRPHEQYTVLKYSSVAEIKEDGTLLFGELQSERKIELGFLRTILTINQEKLEDFYKFLERFLKIKGVLCSLIENDNWKLKKEEGTSLRKVHGLEKDLWVILDSQHFLVGWSVKDRDKYWVSKEMPDFTDAHSYSYRDMSIEKERFIADNFVKIEKILKELEIEKLSSVQKIKDLLKELIHYNKSFRILQKLT